MSKAEVVYRRKSGCSTRICLVGSLGMGTESEKRPGKKVCSRVDDTVGLDLEERRGR